MKNRQIGLDLFTELIYVLGMDYRLDELSRLNGHRVADIIDLQVERQRVKPQLKVAVGDESPPARVVEHPGSAPGRPVADPRPLDKEQQEDVFLPSSHDVS